MKQIFILITSGLLLLSSYNNKRGESKETKDSTATRVENIKFESGYSDVNGLKMYYEIYGEGKPLVLIHGGGSTIQTSFGRIIPELSKHRQIIGLELQAHGRTSDRDTDISFEQDADDVAVLLKNLGIQKADFFGFSNGGMTAMQIAIRHPEIVNKIIVGSSLYKRSGAPEQFWEIMKTATLDHMPKQYKDAFSKVAPNPDNLQIMHDKCAKRMATFKDWDDDQLKSILSPTLLIIGDADLMTPEHAVEMYRLIPNCQLAIIPGGHGEYIGEITTLSDQNTSHSFCVPMLEAFLDKSD